MPDVHPKVARCTRSRHKCAGSVAVFKAQPSERRLRDIHTVAQQAQGRQLHDESVRQIMRGLPPENAF